MLSNRRLKWDTSVYFVTWEGWQRFPIPAVYKKKLDHRWRSYFFHERYSTLNIEWFKNLNIYPKWKTGQVKDRIKFNDSNLNPFNCHSLCAVSYIENQDDKAQHVAPVRHATHNYSAFIYKQDFAELNFLWSGRMISTLSILLEKLNGPMGVRKFMQWSML